MTDVHVKKRKCIFSEEWTATYSWLRPVGGESEKAFCNLWKISFSVGHGGEYYVKQHSTRKSRQKRVQQQEASKSMQSFLPKG